MSNLSAEVMTSYCTFSFITKAEKINGFLLTLYPLVSFANNIYQEQVGPDLDPNVWIH